MTTQPRGTWVGDREFFGTRQGCELIYGVHVDRKRSEGRGGFGNKILRTVGSLINNKCSGYRYDWHVGSRKGRRTGDKEKNSFL